MPTLDQWQAFVSCDGMGSSFPLEKSVDPEADRIDHYVRVCVKHSRSGAVDGSSHGVPQLVGGIPLMRGYCIVT
jgi:hypothetical protein